MFDLLRRTEVPPASHTYFPSLLLLPNISLSLTTGRPPLFCSGEHNTTDELGSGSRRRGAARSVAGGCIPSLLACLLPASPPLDPGMAGEAAGRENLHHRRWCGEQVAEAASCAHDCGWQQARWCGSAGKQAGRATLVVEEAAKAGSRVGLHRRGGSVTGRSGLPAMALERRLCVGGRREDVAGGEVKMKRRGGQEACLTSDGGVADGWAEVHVPCGESAANWGPGLTLVTGSRRGMPVWGGGVCSILREQLVEVAG